MTEVMHSLVNEAKKNKFGVGQNLSDDDIVSVWDNVSSFIEKQMNNQKGVLVPSLGTFTFAQKKLDVGNGKYILIQRPVFVVSEKFAAIHNLNSTKHHTPGHIPIVQLNFSALSFESPFNRDTVESCVREVLNALSRSIASKQNVEFTFNGIGRLQIRSSKVKMRFYKDFLTSMDGSGKLIDALRNRPGTIDSVMSDRPPSRPHTINTLTLPRINQNGPTKDGETTQQMPTIQEEGGGTSPNNITNNNAENLQTSKCDEDLLRIDFDDEAADVENMQGTDGHQITPEMPGDDFEDKLKKPSPPPGIPPSRQGSRMSFTLPKAAAVSFAEDFMPAALASPMIHSASTTRRSLSPINVPPHSATPRLEGIEFSRSKTLDPIGLIKTPSPINANIPTPPRHKGDTPNPPDVTCGHRNAGQELCYLCHQRDRRNIFVSFTDERKKRETEEDKLLQQYQQLKDVEAIFKEEEDNLGKRHENQKIAAFNLGVAEAVKEKKTTRPTDFHPSYVFQKRPLTPPRFLKQDEYYKELAGQVVSKNDTAKKRRGDEDFLERLEQVQLAEDLAAQREQHLKDRYEQQEQYKKALAAQVRFKPLPLPARVPDSSEPVFGKNDMTNEGLHERRRRAYDLYKEQVGSVEQKKREAILKHLNDQKEEENMLVRSKKELQDDRANRYERLFKTRKQLESEWFQALDAKKSRETSEKFYYKDPSALLLEQTDPYKRCGQCKRKVNNCGESNIWRESRYIPGSRLIV